MLDVVVGRTVVLVPIALDVDLRTCLDAGELVLVGGRVVVVRVMVVRVLDKVLGLVKDLCVGPSSGIPVRLYVHLCTSFNSRELRLVRVGEVVVRVHIIRVLDEVLWPILDVVNCGAVVLRPVRLYLRIRRRRNHVVRVDDDVVAGSELVLLSLEAPVEFGARGENRQVRLIPDI